MIQAIGQTLGEAVGIAISPVPIVAVILMLFSAAAARNGVAFLLGWLLGLTGVGLIVLAIGLGSSGNSDSGAIARLVIGIVFILLAIRQWRARPSAGEQPSLPGWIAAVDGFSAPKAFGLALLLAAVNPKNLGLTIAAAASVSSEGLGQAQEVTALLIFVVIASLTIIVPVASYVFARERTQPALDSAKAWLIDNNATVMTVLFMVIGAKVLGDGISGLG